MTEQHTSAPGSGPGRQLRPELAAALLSGNRGRVREAAAELSKAELAEHLRTDEGEQGLREAFNLMPSYYVPGLLDEPVVARWRVERGSAAPVTMDLTLEADRCHLREVDEATRPTVELVLDAVGFVHLASGTTRGMDLLMRGELQVRGNVQAAMRMEALFGLTGQGRK